MVVRRKRKLDVDKGTKALILEEAERLIAENGIDNWRLADIAGPLGIKRPAIYAHYANREAVFTAVLEKAVQDMAAQFQYDPDVDDPRDALIIGIRRYVLHLAQNPAQPRIWLRDLEAPRGGLPGIRTIAGDHLHSLKSGPIGKMAQRLQAILDDGYEQGEFRKRSLVDVARCIFGTTLIGLFFPTQDAFESTGSEQTAHVQNLVENVVLSFLRPD